MRKTGYNQLNRNVFVSCMAQSLLFMDKSIIVFLIISLLQDDYKIKTDYWSSLE
jgi:hypothetical protein